MSYPDNLLRFVESTLQRRGMKRLEVSLCWPARVAVDRELTEADEIEGQRLADEEWYIRIKPVKG